MIDATPRLPYAPLIRDVRKARGLTGTDLGRPLGWSRQTVSDLERGRRRLTLDEAAVIADLLDISLDQLAFAEFVAVEPRMVMKGDRQ